MRRLPLLFFLFCFTGPSWAGTQNTDSTPSRSSGVFDLGIIRIGSSRLQTASGDPAGFEAPRSVSVIGEAALDELGTESLAERLSAEDGVTYSDDMGQGVNARVDLRGFGGEAKQALVLLDGIRAVEPFDNSMTWNLYPSEYLERVEIERGGASPVFGEGALSGAIALQTKNPTDKPHARVEAAAGSFATVREFAEASGTVSGVGVYAAGRHLTTEGYRQNGAHESASTLLKIGGRPSEFLYAQNAFYFADNDTGTPGPLSPQEAEADRRQKDPDGQFGDGFKDRLLQNGMLLRYTLEPVGMELTNLFGYRLRDQDSQRSFGGFFPGTSINAIGTETFSDVVQLSGRAEGENWGSRTSAGIEWSHDDIHNPFTFLDFTFGAFRSDRSIDRRMLGAFAHNETVWFERWTLETGVRWDRIKWDIYDHVDESLEKHKKTDSVSPSLGLSYRIADPLSVFASYSQAFKAPDSNTLIFETPNLFTPTPDIDSSLARHQETGLRYEHPVFGSIRAALFEVDTKKEILFNDISNRNENFDTIRRGAELGWRAAPRENVEIFGALAWTRARFDNGAFDERAIPLVPELKWSAGAAWRIDKAFSLAVRASGVRDQFALNDFDNRFRMEDYATLDVKWCWKRGNAEIWLAGRNLSGEEYSSFAASDGVSTLNLNPSPEQQVEAGIRFEI